MVTVNAHPCRQSKSNAALPPPAAGSQPGVLGKCVSASHLVPPRPLGSAGAVTRSSLAITPGYILRADGGGINITKVRARNAPPQRPHPPSPTRPLTPALLQVDDIAEWLEPPAPLKRTSPDAHLNQIEAPPTVKPRRVRGEPLPDPLPAFLRNQSVEGLESTCKREADAPLPFCRHISIPDNCEVRSDDDSDSSDDDPDMCNWYRNVSSFKKIEKMDVDQTRNPLAGIVKIGENLLGKKTSYDVTDVTLRHPGERKLPEVDSRRFNIDQLTKSPMMAEGVKNIPKTLEVQKEPEKTGFFTKKLLSPKLSRLFKPNTAEVVRNKPENEKEDKPDKSRSKFFIQRPASPNLCRSSYKVRPVDEADKKHRHDTKQESNLLKSDLKLASMGKPMTPIFRRHVPNERPDFADGRFSYRERKTKYDHKVPEPKFIDVGRNRIKAPVNVDKTKLAPLIRSSPMSNIPALATVPEKKLESIKNKDVVKKREPGISRTNYVSLANLKINSKKDLEKTVDGKALEAINVSSPIERVI